MPSAPQPTKTQQTGNSRNQYATQYERVIKMPERRSGEPAGIRLIYRKQYKENAKGRGKDKYSSNPIRHRKILFEAARAPINGSPL
jgi:hypothetical protein